MSEGLLQSNPDGGRSLKSHENTLFAFTLTSENGALWLDRQIFFFYQVIKGKKKQPFWTANKYTHKSKCSTRKSQNFRRILTNLQPSHLVILGIPTVRWLLVGALDFCSPRALAFKLGRRCAFTPAHVNPERTEGFVRACARADRCVLKAAHWKCNNVFLHASRGRVCSRPQNLKWALHSTPRTCLRCRWRISSCRSSGGRRTKEGRKGFFSCRFFYFLHCSQR